MKSSVYNIIHFSFYFNVLLGTIMNFMDKPQYSFPPNMGSIIMLGLVCIIYDNNSNSHTPS